jgi:hypothetical protein
LLEGSLYVVLVPGQVDKALLLSCSDVLALPLESQYPQVNRLETFVQQRAEVSIDGVLQNKQALRELESDLVLDFVVDAFVYRVSEVFKLNFDVLELIRCLLCESGLALVQLHS